MARAGRLVAVSTLVMWREAVAEGRAARAARAVDAVRKAKVRAYLRDYESGYSTGGRTTGGHGGGGGASASVALSQRAGEDISDKGGAAGGGFAFALPDSVVPSFMERLGV